MSKRGHKEKIDDALTKIKLLKTNIDSQITSSKIEEFDEEGTDNNRSLYEFMYRTNLYTNMQILNKLLTDIKTSDIDFDGTAVEYVIDRIIAGCSAADRELTNQEQSRRWHRKMENIGDRLEKMLDILLKLLSTNIYNLKYTKAKIAWGK